MNYFFAFGPGLPNQTSWSILFTRAQWPAEKGKSRFDVFRYDKSMVMSQ